MSWMLWVCFVCALLLLKLYLRASSGACRCTRHLQGCLAVVTGSNCGIGYETARELAVRGARVVLACRDPARGAEACSRLIRDTGGDVSFKQLDLASFRSVRAFAADLLANENKLDILINNAGVGRLDNSLTEDGIVIEAQINHFAPFLLTNLLLPLLKASPQGRIINVSSIMHYLGTINLDTMACVATGKIAHQLAYSNMKLCNILFTLELARRLEGTRVTANSLHPGAVNTNIYRNIISPVRYLVKFMMPKTSRDGAQTSIHLALSPDLSNVSGKYFADCKEAMSSWKSRDKALAKKLWDTSERVVKLE